jgi:hypothetical protein
MYFFCLSTTRKFIRVAAGVRLSWRPPMACPSCFYPAQSLDESRQMACGASGIVVHKFIMVIILQHVVRPFQVLSTQPVSRNAVQFILPHRVWSPFVNDAISLRRRRALYALAPQPLRVKRLSFSPLDPSLSTLSHITRYPECCWSFPADTRAPPGGGPPGMPRVPFASVSRNEAAFTAAAAAAKHLCPHVGSHVVTLDRSELSPGGVNNARGGGGIRSSRTDDGMSPCRYMRARDGIEDRQLYRAATSATVGAVRIQQLLVARTPPERTSTAGGVLAIAGLIYMTQANGSSVAGPEAGRWSSHGERRHCRAGLRRNGQHSDCRRRGRRKKRAEQQLVARGHLGSKNKVVGL